MVDFSIIGAGVAGLCVATELAKRGASISLCDPAGAPGAHGCSWWAGGMLAPCCEGETAEEPVVRLGKLAADWWQKHAGQVKQLGTLVVTPSRDHAELERFGRRTSGHRSLNGPEIAALEPDLAGQFSHALYYEDEAHVAPRSALAALATGLAEKGIEIAAGEPGSGTSIDCRGLAARDKLTDMRGVKGEMLILHCPDVCLSRPVRLLHPRIPIYIVPRGDGIYMLGATMIESSDRSRITARSMLELLSAAYALHPAFGEAEVVEIGVDARPAFADNMPRIRKIGSTIYANGLYRHGFLLAPALGAQVADLVLDNKQPEFWG